METLRQQAHTLYIESANVLRNYKPYSSRELANALAIKGVEISHNTLARWIKEGGWAQEAQQNAKATKALVANLPITKEELDIVKNTSSLNAKIITILNKVTDTILNRQKHGGDVTLDEIEILLKTLAISNKVNVDNVAIEAQTKPRLELNSVIDKLNVIEAEIEE